MATRNGHRVGSRSTLELLGAEVDAINSEQALFVEQTQYLLNRLRLSALTSDLSEADLKIVNAYLKWLAKFKTAKAASKAAFSLII